jgi:hypothetical protein
MANLFEIEWTEKGQRIRDRVHIGNFNGTTEEAQRVIDRLWPVAFDNARTNVKVGKPVGSGEVTRVTPGPSKPADAK